MLHDQGAVQCVAAIKPYNVFELLKKVTSQVPEESCYRIIVSDSPFGNTEANPMPHLVLA